MIRFCYKSNKSSLMSFLGYFLASITIMFCCYNTAAETIVETQFQDRNIFDRRNLSVNLHNLFPTTDRNNNANSFYNFSDENAYIQKQSNGKSENKFYIQSEAGYEQVGIEDALRSYPKLEIRRSERPVENENFRDEWNSGNYVATTPRTNWEASKALVSYDESYEDEGRSEGSSISSFLSQAKTMWDMYRAFSTAWSAISVDSNGQRSAAGNMSDDERLKRQSLQETTTISNDDMVTTTEVAAAEGRYIKGDPLKGYYDFVITEGSYKFWAAFQLATAILIIYSTFAAIYYSKVNPLVGDYEYVDYLGGGRSMSGDIPDFEDTTDPNDEEESTEPYRGQKPMNSTDSSSIFGDTLGRTWTSIVQGQWLSKAGHAFEFVLDAIERIPKTKQ